MTDRRAALAALLLLAACAAPTGVAVEECNTSWRGLDPQIATGAATTSASASRSPACGGSTSERISIGFEMPPGPDCYELAAVELDESADAVAVTLLVSLIDDVRRLVPDRTGPYA